PLFLNVPLLLPLLIVGWQALRRLRACHPPQPHIAEQPEDVVGRRLVSLRADDLVHVPAGPADVLAHWCTRLPQFGHRYTTAYLSVGFTTNFHQRRANNQTPRKGTPKVNT